MQEMVAIRILETDNNRRGDLFGRLMGDLFVALGYERPRLNVHKSGRELDLTANHRLEPRHAIAECKATTDSIGGKDLNKFVGVLDAEYNDDRPLTGYFISLSGFTEPALEQEKQRRRTKIITLDGPQVVSELVRGRILIPLNRATELAGRFCAALDHLVLDSEAELLAHERGWIWAVYYTQGANRTNFVLIHSDGTPLARALADEVISADRACGGTLHMLTCLNPTPPLGADTDPRVSDALVAYRRYLENECGFILLDGLPAESDVGSRRLRLETLFVPLHLDIPSEERGRQPVGDVIAMYPRLALLAAPGGGKSTLIKRLAIAYVDHSRREQIADDLPPRDWLPLFLRCRELRDLARGSFADLIEALSEREPVRQHAAVFRAYVDRALLNGRILLLVDGLDEISDPGDRAAFVGTLRAALQAYPGIAIVVTSREAGFRHVAAHLAPICTQTALSPFNADDISRLSVAWHREVVGDTEKVRADAEQLATTIALNDRINRLAINPLLLTTLLLVKRWVGSLPTRRSVLYGKAVEVLLMTWNTEGHDPIPEEEALPQLCYVASAMMLEGVFKISRPRLASLLQESRRALPTELGYVKGTVDEFIHRVEDRSSLLMMAGLDVEDGRLVEFFEFRHLTFQEFLTARAMVEGWHPGRRESDTLVSVLEPHFEKEGWREVIPLAAVLGGKATEGLIQRLTEKLGEIGRKEVRHNNPLVLALVNCLADEAAARPETIRAALREVLRFGTLLTHDPSTRMLVRGRYGADFRSEAGKALLSATSDFADLGDALTAAVLWQTLQSENANGYKDAAKRFVEMLSVTDNLSRAEGATGIGRLCHDMLRDVDRQAKLTACADHLRRAGPILMEMLEEALPVFCSAAYALESLFEGRVWAPPSVMNVRERLFRVWRENTDETIRNLSLRALVACPLGTRDDESQFSPISRAEVENLLKSYEQLGDWPEQHAVLILAWQLRLLDDAELIRRVRALRKNTDFPSAPTMKELLENLGETP